MTGVLLWIRIGEGDEYQVGTAAAREEVPALLHAVADELTVQMHAPGADAEPAEVS